jgi:hypothetical protein
LCINDVVPRLPAYPNDLADVMVEAQIDTFRIGRVGADVVGVDLDLAVSFGWAKMTSATRFSSLRIMAQTSPSMSLRVIRRYFLPGSGISFGSAVIGEEFMPGMFQLLIAGHPLKGWGFCSLGTEGHASEDNLQNCPLPQKGKRSALPFGPPRAPR